MRLLCKNPICLKEPSSSRWEPCLVFSPFASWPGEGSRRGRYTAPCGALRTTPMHQTPSQCLGSVNQPATKACMPTPTCPWSSSPPQTPHTWGLRPLNNAPVSTPNLASNKNTQARDPHLNLSSFLLRPVLALLLVVRATVLQPSCPRATMPRQRRLSQLPLEPGVPAASSPRAASRLQKAPPLVLKAPICGLLEAIRPAIRLAAAAVQCSRTSRADLV